MIIDHAPINRGLLTRIEHLEQENEALKQAFAPYAAQASMIEMLDTERLRLIENDDAMALFAMEVAERVKPLILDHLAGFEDRLSDLESQLAALKAGAGQGEAPPAEIVDLLHPGEAHGDAQERLFEIYKDIQSRMMMSLATQEEMDLHTRLHGALNWIRRGAVEVT